MTVAGGRLSAMPTAGPISIALTISAQSCAEGCSGLACMIDLGSTMVFSSV